MPLTAVVDYFNEHLHQLHPQARLGSHATLRYRNGTLSATVCGFRVSPQQLPVVRADDGAMVAHSAQLRVTSKSGRLMKPESLYLHASATDDVIFLDRFLRVLHALNHLEQGHEDDARLVLDIHHRHLAAVPEHQGKVFRSLLQRLGLEPQHIVLRMQGRALQRDAQARQGLRGFADRGYRLLVSRPELNETDWTEFKALGIDWISPDIPARGPLQNRELVEQGINAARAEGIRLWADGIDSPRALEQAHSLGAELVEGLVLRPASPRVAGVSG